MKFDLIDRVLELSEDRVVAVKQVTISEEYLADHFPTFPILPGVLMLETMVQAARRLLGARDPALCRHVLGEVRALKFGSMIKPGEALRVEVDLLKAEGEDRYAFKGVARRLRPGEPLEESPTAASGRFVLRPIRISVTKATNPADTPA